MLPRARWVLVLVAVAGVGQTPAQEQSHLAGFVRDSSLGMAPEAVIAAVNEETGFRRTVRSDPEGAYAIWGLQPGIYKVIVRKEGFRTLVRFGVKLEAAKTTRLDVTLMVGSVQESITVEAESLGPNTEEGALGTAIGREWIERLPLNGRGLISLLELAPGAVVTPASRGEAGQFTVNGQRPNTNYFTVDGVSVNTVILGGGQPAQPAGGSLPAMSAFGSFHGLVALEALEEFRMQSSTAGAEFGRLPGAQISLSTRTGSNQLHGSLSYYGRHEKLDANDWFANRQGASRAPLRLGDFGAALGGPIRRDRTFYFLAHENLKLRQPATWRIAVPSLEARQGSPAWAQPLLDSFPPPRMTNGRAGATTGEWTGQSSRPAGLRSSSARLDHGLGSGVSLFGRAQMAPSEREFGSAQVNRFGLDSRGWALGVSAQHGAAVRQDFRAGYTQLAAESVWRQGGLGLSSTCSLATVAAHIRGGGIDCGQFLRFAISGLNQVVAGREADTRQHQWNLLHAMAASLGRHQVRAGVDYRQIDARRPRQRETFSVMADNLADLLAQRNLWTVTFQPVVNRVVLREVSLFAHDVWRVTPRLTLSYGLRWELAPEPFVAEAAVERIPSASPFESRMRLPSWPGRHSRLAPRFGAARQLGRGGRTVLRGGAGIYYDSSLVAANDFLNGGPLPVWPFVSPAPEVSGPTRSVLSYDFAPDLRLPKVWQWNVTLERTVEEGNMVSASYVGSSGRSLLRREVGGAAAFGLVTRAVATNHGESDFHALELQWRSRANRWLRALFSYTWSHSIDNSSSDALLHWSGSGYEPSRDRGSSDFDVRHAFHAAFSLDPPKRLPRLARWSVDGLVRARTGFPINILNAENAMGLPFANVFRPSLAPAVPVWSQDRFAPGGRRLNREAFRTGGGFEQGTLGRNAIRGFGMAQVDVSLRREFPLRDRAALQAGIEVFNLFNQANLADPVRYLASPLFGESPSMLNTMLGTGTTGSGLAPMMQIGGPRSIQVALRLRF